MDLKRFFSDVKIKGETASLSGEEFFHAVKVTRHKVGYKLIICDNSGKDFYATVSEIRSDSLIAKIDEVRINETESDFNVDLYIGNNKDLDVVVQKAVELGVKRIIPFTSDHCNVKTVNYDRLNKIILESSKQCGRSVLAEISNLISFNEIPEKVKNSQVFAFYEFEESNKIKNEKLNNKNISIIVGCEGGFSNEEVNFLRNKGIKTFTLGKRILRVATAVVAACVLINDKAEN